MIHRRSTFFLGLFITLIPFLGLPTASKTTLIILSGVFLVYSSITIALPERFKKTAQKSGIKPLAKPIAKRKPRKEKTSTTVSGSIVYSENNSVDSPKIPDIE